MTTEDRNAAFSQHALALVRRALGEQLFDYRGFTLHTAPIHFVNGLTWPHFEDYFNLLFGCPLDKVVVILNEHTLLDALFLTFATNSIDNHYGSFEVQVYLYARLFLASQPSKAASPVQVLEKAKELMTQFVGEAKYAKILAVVTRICKERIATVHAKISEHGPAGFLELKYYSIWDEALRC
jgi:hypothetical protein